MRAAAPRRSSSARCSRAHTPAACQSRSRRQQVGPLPKPAAVGSRFHGIPVRSTNRIPFSAAGRPPARPLGAGGAGGSSGRDHGPQLSDTSAFISHPPSGVPRAARIPAPVLKRTLSTATEVHATRAPRPATRPSQTRDARSGSDTPDSSEREMHLSARRRRDTMFATTPDPWVSAARGPEARFVVEDRGCAPPRVAVSGTGFVSFFRRVVVSPAAARIAALGSRARHARLVVRRRWRGRRVSTAPAACGNAAPASPR
jgi:hypothetical protein